jgi:hypothetical protein
MSLTIYSGQDLRYGIAPQTAWGTAAIDAAAVVQLDIDHPAYDKGVNIRKNVGANGVRFGIIQDTIADQQSILTKIPIKMSPSLATLDLFLYMYFQKVVETASGVYKKVFTFPVLNAAQQPDFTAVGPAQGFYNTIFAQSAITAQSEKIADVICEDIELSFGAKNPVLSMTANLIGRGPAAVCTPAGTWTRVTPAWWYWASLGSTTGRATINFGAGAQAVRVQDFQIKLANAIEGAGAFAGTYESMALTKRTGTFKLTILLDANVATAVTNYKAGTITTFRVGIGNATAGAASGDLDFAWTGIITKVDLDHADVLGATIEGELLSADSATTPITVTMANSISRSW